MSDPVWMADLLKRVPVLRVDVGAARKAGDVAALAYHRAVTEWLGEASLAIQETEMDGPHHGGDLARQQAEPWGPVGKFVGHLIDLSPYAGASNDAAEA